MFIPYLSTSYDCRISILITLNDMVIIFSGPNHITIEITYKIPIIKHKFNSEGLLVYGQTPTHSYATYTLENYNVMKKTCIQ